VPAYQTSNSAYQGQGQFVYQTQTITPPAVSVGQGGGRWFGYHPTYEEKKELKSEIKQVVREKKEIERKLSSPNRQDLYYLIERLQTLQKRLDSLTTEYVYLIESWKTYRQKLEDEEEEEFLLFISSNL
jgi:hypothetical protein